MNTIKEGDNAARLMRDILNMNPAFGIYLQEDKDLVGVVQLFAKRFRKISLTEGSSQMSPTVLYQPLCEMVWRVVGLTMSSMMNLNNQSSMPIVKEATGMIKMLLQTNTELSSQLSHLRRMYFKELTVHRDKQRNLGKQAEQLINGLQEQPIMFFEPLEFVLDETTKEFVRQAIEERMKLEIRVQPKQEGGENAEMTAHLEQCEKDLQEAQAKVRVLNNTVAREAEVRKRHEEIENKLREEIRMLREGGGDATKEIGRMQDKLRSQIEERTELENRIKELQEKLQDEQRQNSELSDELSKAQDKETVVMEDTSSNEALAKMQEQIKKMEREAKKKEEQIKEEKRKAEESEKAMKQLTEKTGVKEIVKEKIVYKESPEMEERVQKSLEVEKELREALRISELRAKEAEAKAGTKVITKEVIKKDKSSKGRYNKDKRR